MTCKRTWYQSHSSVRLLASLAVRVLTGSLCERLFSSLSHGNDDDFLDYYIELVKTDGRISDLVRSKYELHIYAKNSLVRKLPLLFTV